MHYVANSVSVVPIARLSLNSPTTARGGRLRPRSSPCLSSPRAAGSTSSATSSYAEVVRKYYCHCRGCVKSRKTLPIKTDHLSGISDCDNETICESDNEMFDEDGAEGIRSGAGRSLTPKDSARAGALFLQPAEDGALLASYSVFVVEPGAGKSFDKCKKKINGFSQLLYISRCGCSVHRLRLNRWRSPLLAALSLHCVRHPLPPHAHRQRLSLLGHDLLLRKVGCRRGQGAVHDRGVRPIHEVMARRITVRVQV
jgi:hypothetical protein